MKITDLINICNGTILNERVTIKEKFKNIITDTREIKQDDIFIALKGNNFDGHNYVNEAIEKGAICIFVEQDILIDTSIPIVKVTDTYQCLFNLASYYLKCYPVNVIAVTGSVGKTTTKELLAAILSKKYQVLKSEGNKNNRIGIPQTIFKLNSDVDFLVIELGMNHFHEIEALSNLVHPNIALITNIGSAHIGNLGSKKNILKAKLEIISGMENGILIVNGNDSYLKNIKVNKNIQVIKTNYKKDNIKIKLLEQLLDGSKIEISDKKQKEELIFKSPGKNILNNISLVLCVAKMFEIPFELIIEALKEYKPIKQRFITEYLPNNNILINDSYNSSYESLKMNLDLLKQFKQHKILILGDILELGSKSQKIHQKIGKQLKKLSNAEVYFIGNEMKYAYEKYKDGFYFKEKKEWIDYWNKQNKISNSIIMLKGSRRMQLEDLIEYFRI